MTFVLIIDFHVFDYMLVIDLVYYALYICYAAYLTYLL